MVLLLYCSYTIPVISRKLCEYMATLLFYFCNKFIEILVNLDKSFFLKNDNFFDGIRSELMQGMTCERCRLTYRRYSWFPFAVIHINDNCRKIRLREGNAKCRHLKKFTCKGTSRLVLSA